MAFRKRPGERASFRPSDAHQAFSTEDIDIEALARRLEQAFQSANKSLLDFAEIPPEAIVDSFIAIQARLLGFDAHSTQAFVEATEAARVKTLSQGNLFLACALCSAVALSQFKQQPLPTLGPWRRPARRIRGLSTHSLSLGAFAVLSFYTLLGSKTYTRLRRKWQNRSFGI